MKKKILSAILTVSLMISGFLVIPQVTVGAEGLYENEDMTVLVPCENKSEASWVTNGADIVVENSTSSPDKQNFKLNINDGGEFMFGTSVPSEISTIEGFAFWVKIPDISGFYFVLQADCGNRHYQFTGTSGQLQTYYTIDKNGIFSEHQIDWKNFSLSGFEGFVIVPNSGFKYNWGGTEAAFDPKAITSIGIYTDPQAGKTMEIDDFGCVSNLNGFRSSHEGKNYGGNFENSDMTVMVPCENKSEAGWVTNGVDATLTSESISPDGKNFNVNIGNGGETLFTTAIPENAPDIAGFVFWVKTPDVPGFYFVLEADNGGKHYIFSGTTSNLATYYTIDKNGVYAEHQIDWKNFSLTNFEGFVIVPKEGFRFNWGGTEAPFQANALTSIGTFSDPYPGQSISVDDFGYYHDLNAYKSSHIGRNFGGKSALLQKIDEATSAYEKGELYYTGGWNEFVTAYYNALSVRDSANSTETEIASAVTSLSDCLNGLEVTVDRTAMIEILEETKAAYDAGSISYASGWDDFSSAYESADTINQNINSTQQQLDDAVVELRTAYDALILKYENKIVLEEMLLDDGAAKMAYDAGESGYQSGWADFVSAYNDAVAVAADASASNDEVDAALLALTTAMANLKAVQYNESTDENKNMVVVNDGSNTEQIAYNNGRVAIHELTLSKDGKAYEIAVKPATENSNVVDISFNVMYPYDFDIDSAEGFVFWFKTPAGATSPWLNFDVHCGNMHFKLHELEFFMVDKNGTLYEKQGPAILSPEFEGWVIIPKSSIKFNWGAGGSQTFDMKNVTSVGFNTAPDEEGGSAGKSFVADDFSVYTDLEALKTTLGVKSAVTPTVPADNETEDNTKQDASDLWVINSDTAAYDSGYGSIMNLKENDSITVQDIDFGTKTADKVILKLNIVNPGSVLVYKINADNSKTLLGTVHSNEATFEATEFGTSLSQTLTGTVDIQFVFKDGFQGDMMSFEFAKSDESIPDTGDTKILYVIFLACASLSLMVYGNKKRIKS